MGRIATYEHARPVIRSLFQEVYDHSTALLNRLRSADQSDGGPAPAIAEIHTLRERLAKRSTRDRRDGPAHRGRR